MHRILRNKNYQRDKNSTPQCGIRPFTHERQLAVIVELLTTYTLFHPKQQGTLFSAPLRGGINAAKQMSLGALRFCVKRV